jgi:erythromycin esterase
MMKEKLFVFIIISFMLISVAYGQKAAKEVSESTRYLNLDFEDFIPNLKPKFWYTGGVGYEAVVDKTVIYSGSTSLRLESEGEKRNFGVATSTFPITSARGKKIRYSGFIKTENVKEGYAGLWWRVDGKEQKSLAFDNMADRGPKETTDWKEYVIEVEVPGEAININFGVLLTGTGKAWFDGLKIALDGKLYKQVKPAPIVPGKKDLEWIRANAIPLKTAEPISPHTDLIPVKKLIGNRRIVALGEGTHGTSEFFKMKHRMTRFLAEEMGFTVFAIEANMPEAREVNRYVLTGEGDPRKALDGLYFWTWNTSEVLDMIKWMREYNLSGKGKIEFYGFDMQFPKVAMENVSEFVKKADKDFVKSLEEQYKQVNEVYESARKSRYRGNIDYKKWHNAANLVYNHLKTNRETYIKQLDTMEVDWAVQDARVVVQAVEAFMPGKASRDQSMADNLDWILDHKPKGTKVVTWAHNGHVSKGFQHYKSMGTFLAKQHGDDMIVFGFAFHEGEYTAFGKNSINTYSTTKSEPGSLEWFFKSSGIPNLILDLREALKGEEGAKWLNRELDFRSIGAMALDYAFSPRKIINEFDAIIYFEKTTPSDCFRSLKNKKETKEEIKK